MTASQDRDERLLADINMLTVKIGRAFEAIEKDLRSQGRTPTEARSSLVAAAFMLIVEDFVSTGGGRGIIETWVEMMLNAYNFPQTH